MTNHVGAGMSRLFILVLLLLTGWVRAAEVRVGDVPALPTMATLDGKTIRPASLRGKTVVLSYFSTTCPFCMNEAPKLQKLHRDNPGKLVVIGVNVDDKDPAQKSKMADWVRKYRLTHPVVTDFASVAAVLGKPKGLPVTYVLDRQGRVSRIDIGEIFDEDFDDIGRYAQQD